MSTYGYARVSTCDQNEDRQIIAMEKFGVKRSRIVVEKRSGKDFDRPLYRELIHKLKPRDRLVIKSIDRLGRNYEEILEQWRILTKEKQAEIVVLDMPLLNTLRMRELTGTLIADIVLQLLSYVAQTEREFLRIRQREGIDAARARGIHYGRRAMEHPANYDEVVKKWQNGELTGRAASTRLGVSHTTFLRWMKKEETRANASRIKERDK